MHTGLMLYVGTKEECGRKTDTIITMMIMMKRQFKEGRRIIRNNNSITSLTVDML